MGADKKSASDWRAGTGAGWQETVGEAGAISLCSARNAPPILHVAGVVTA